MKNFPRPVFVFSPQTLPLFHPVATSGNTTVYRWIPDEFLETKIGGRLYEMLLEEINEK